MAEYFFDGRVVLHCDDCMAALARIDDCSIDSCVTDPPYHLTSIVKRFGNANAEREVYAATNPVRNAYGTRGFMGKVWDGGDIAFRPETWTAVYRVLKPGGYLIAFSGTRTYHRMACAIEDAGFDVRDMVSWLYGSGFPKSHDVSKGIDRAAGAVRKIVGSYKATGTARTLTGGNYGGGGNNIKAREQIFQTAPATAEAREWEGWGTALKPALEPICMARKPLSEKTVAANVLAHGTGAINVDGCRVVTDEQIEATRNIGLGSSSGGIYGAADVPGVYVQHVGGRWPANVIHDGSEEVVAAFPESVARPVLDDKIGVSGSGESRGMFGMGSTVQSGYRDTETSAARFFYTAKADGDDRLGSKHPTVKPVDLIQYLVRLVTPKRGLVLDPFAGTGTAAEAALREGMRAVLIEAEADYQADIRRRMALALAGPDERLRESIKAKGLPLDYGPLFAGKEGDGL